MPERRRAKLWVAGILGGAVVATAVYFGFFARSHGTGPASAAVRQRSARQSVAGAQSGAAGQRSPGAGSAHATR